MPATPKPQKPYQAHRETQRERILDAAEPLFVQAGIDGVSLSDIARAAGMTRNTVYEYFPSKQEVAWAILQRIFERGRGGEPVRGEGRAYARLEQFMFGMANQVREHPQDLRFIVEFNTLYARETSAERMRQATARAAGEGPVALMVRQGIADGSLRPDLDPGLVSAAAWNLLSGMNSRFALLGDRIEEEYGLPVMVIYAEICRAFLRGLQNPLSRRTQDEETKL